MVAATKIPLQVQFRAFDELHPSIQEALNYANVGFTARDILYLHSLYVTKHLSADKIVKMIHQRDTFETLLSPWGRKMT